VVNSFRGSFKEGHRSSDATRSKAWTASSTSRSSAICESNQERGFYSPVWHAVASVTATSTTSVGIACDRLAAPLAQTGLQKPRSDGSPRHSTFNHTPERRDWKCRRSRRPRRDMIALRSRKYPLRDWFHTQTCGGLSYDACAFFESHREPPPRACRKRIACGFLFSEERRIARRISLCHSRRSRS
jgi:hypothetical protein